VLALRQPRHDFALHTAALLLTPLRIVALALAPRTAAPRYTDPDRIAASGSLIAFRGLASKRPTGHAIACYRLLTNHLHRAYNSHMPTAPGGSVQQVLSAMLTHDG
jgi:hypothetical protein